MHNTFGMAVSYVEATVNIFTDVVASMASTLVCFPTSQEQWAEVEQGFMVARGFIWRRWRRRRLDTT